MDTNTQDYEFENALDKSLRETEAESTDYVRMIQMCRMILAKAKTKDANHQDAEIDDLYNKLYGWINRLAKKYLLSDEKSELKSEEVEGTSYSFFPEVLIYDAYLKESFEKDEYLSLESKETSNLDEEQIRSYCEGIFETWELLNISRDDRRIVGGSNAGEVLFPAYVFASTVVKKSDDKKRRLSLRNEISRLINQRPRFHGTGENRDINYTFMLTKFLALCMIEGTDTRINLAETRVLGIEKEPEIIKHRNVFTDKFEYTFRIFNSSVTAELIDPKDLVPMAAQNLYCVNRLSSLLDWYLIMESEMDGIMCLEDALFTKTYLSRCLCKCDDSLSSLLIRVLGNKFNELCIEVDKATADVDELNCETWLQSKMEMLHNDERKNDGVESRCISIPMERCTAHLVNHILKLNNPKENINEDGRPKEEEYQKSVIYIAQDMARLQEGIEIVGCLADEEAEKLRSKLLSEWEEKLKKLYDAVDNKFQECMEAGMRLYLSNNGQDNQADVLSSNSIGQLNNTEKAKEFYCEAYWGAAERFAEELLTRLVYKEICNNIHSWGENLFKDVSGKVLAKAIGELKKSLSLVRPSEELNKFVRTWCELTLAVTMRGSKQKKLDNSKEFRAETAKKACDAIWAEMGALIDEEETAVLEKYTQIVPAVNMVTSKLKKNTSVAGRRMDYVLDEVCGVIGDGDIKEMFENGIEAWKDYVLQKLDEGGYQIIGTEDRGYFIKECLAEYVQKYSSDQLGDKEGVDLLQDVVGEVVSVYTEEMVSDIFDVALELLCNMISHGFLRQCSVGKFKIELDELNSKDERLYQTMGNRVSVKRASPQKPYYASGIGEQKALYAKMYCRTVDRDDSFKDA